MFKKIIYLVLLITSVQVFAQQKPQYTMYMANPYLVNPAMAGSEEYVDIKLQGRMQWTGWAGAPQTYVLTAHSALRPFQARHHYSDQRNWLGLGIKLISDESGPLKNTGGYVTASYNYEITKGKKYGLVHTQGTRLAVGLSFGMMQMSLVKEKFQYQTKLEEIAASDGAVSGALASSRTKGDMNFGFWLYNDNYYIGLSGLQLLYNDVGFVYTQQELEQKSREIGAQLKGHYFLMFGYKLALAELWDVYPSLFIKTVPGAPVSVDLNGKIVYNQGKSWIGISYRHKDALNLLVGVNYKKSWDISYSYDMTTSRIRVHSSGSHELCLGYRLYRDWVENNPSDHWGKRMKRHKKHHW